VEGKFVTVLLELELAGDVFVIRNHFFVLFFAFIWSLIEIHLILVFEEKLFTAYLVE